MSARSETCLFPAILSCSLRDRPVQCRGRTMHLTRSARVDNLRRIVARTLRQERRRMTDRRQESSSLLDRIEQKRLALERDRRAFMRRAADRRKPQSDGH